MSDGVARGGYLSDAAFVQSLEGPRPGHHCRPKPEKLNISTTEPDPQAAEAFDRHGVEGYFKALARQPRTN